MAEIPKVLGNCRYKVQIGSIMRYVREVETVAVETAPTPYNLGMNAKTKAGLPNVAQLPTVQQQATRIKLTVVSETGKTDMFDWYDKCNNQGKLRGNTQDATITYYDEQGSPGLAISIQNAYPINYSLATASADGQEYLTEIVELTGTDLKLKAS